MRSALFRLVAVCLLLMLVIAAVPAVAEADVVMDTDKVYWIGQGFTYVYVDDPSYSAQFVKVESTNPKVLKVKHGEDDGLCFYLKPVKAGRSTLELTYELDGRQATLKKTVQVKKYPSPITSLKVNGKTVKLKKNKFTYTVSKFKKTSAIIKVKASKGWKVKGVYADIEYVGYKKLKNGKSFKIPKDGRASVWIDLVNGKKQLFTYRIEINRI